jgi:hypothetical protein
MGHDTSSVSLQWWPSGWCFLWFVFDHQGSKRRKRHTRQGRHSGSDHGGSAHRVGAARRIRRRRGSGASQGWFVLGLSEGGINTYHSERWGPPTPVVCRAKYE